MTVIASASRMPEGMNLEVRNIKTKKATHSIPTIHVAQGALHCDFIYTTDTTKFGDTHTRFGLRPTWGMSQTLAQAIGIRKAKELSFTARVVKGDEALRLGLANDSFAGQAELAEFR